MMQAYEEWIWDAETTMWKMHLRKIKLKMYKK